MQTSTDNGHYSVITNPPLMIIDRLQQMLLFNWLVPSVRKWFYSHPHLPITDTFCKVRRWNTYKLETGSRGSSAVLSINSSYRLPRLQNLINAMAQMDQNRQLLDAGPSAQFYSFLCSFQKKFGPIIAWRPAPLRLAPDSGGGGEGGGESWICPC